MGNINWEDSFKKGPLEESDFENQIIGNNSSSDSFADRFIGMRSRTEKKALNGQDMHSHYYEQYEPTAQKNGTGSNGEKKIPRQDSFLQKEPVFDFNAEYNEDMDHSSSWRFYDLKNKKQTGDLYKKILYYNKTNNSQVFNFVSSRGKEGVTSVVANLVNYINSQKANKKILVIDANIQSPSLDRIFNIPGNTYGLTDIFYNRIGAQQAVTQISSNIFVLCCSGGNDRKSDNIEQDNFLTLINYYRQIFDFIIMDSPPVLSSSDALSISSSADFTFIIVQSAKIKKQVLEKTKTVLQNDECQIGGIILNRVNQVIPGWVYKFI